jgi:dienelactone hydrolase
MDQTSEAASIEPTIVLIGGSPSNESYWERLAERLQEQGFIVVAPPSGSRNVG